MKNLATAIQPVGSSCYAVFKSMSGLRLFKRASLFLALMFLFVPFEGKANSKFVFAKNQATIHNSLEISLNEVEAGWQKVSVSKSSVVVLYKVETCNGKSKIILALQNGSAKKEVADFYLMVSKAEDSPEGFTNTVSLSVPANTTVEGNCDDSAALKELSMALPEGFNPAQVKVKAMFRFE
jgi:hypothetical protein